MDSPPRTVEEFEQRWAERMGVTAEPLDEYGCFGEPCDCDVEPYDCDVEPCESSAMVYDADRDMAERIRRAIWPEPVVYRDAFADSTWFPEESWTGGQIPLPLWLGVGNPRPGPGPRPDAAHWQPDPDHPIVDRCWADVWSELRGSYHECGAESCQESPAGFCLEHHRRMVEIEDGQPPAASDEPPRFGGARPIGRIGEVQVTEDGLSAEIILDEVHVWPFDGGVE